MNQLQIDALASVAGRTLSAEEIAALDPLVSARNDVEIAKSLSNGRTRHNPTAIGPGTVLAVMGARGGAFLDAVTALGDTDRSVYWGMDPVRRGALDLSIPAARGLIAGLKAKLPDYAADIDKLLGVGVGADPIDFNTVSNALNKAEGRMTL